MNFEPFDKTEQARLSAEVKERWGGSAAYQEYQQRQEEGATGGHAELMAQFVTLGQLKHLSPAAPEVQAAIHSLRQFITRHFYTCTPEFLAQLGEMYVADDRFRQNIDKAGGEGTAEFAAQAIRLYRERQAE